MAACGNFGNVAQNDCEDCVQVVKTTKRVQIPCTRNTYKQYTVKVPRQVEERVPREEMYTDVETRTKQVPYTENRNEERVRMEARSFQVPVQKTNTRMVSVTRKMPKTVYVDVTTQVPQQYTETVMECRTKQVPVKYNVAVPVTKYKTVEESVPVQKKRIVHDNVVKTVYDTQVRTQCVPVTKMVTKTVPVYNVVARPPAACPQGMDCGQDDNNVVHSADMSGGYAGSQAGGYAGSQAGGYAQAGYASAQMGAAMGGAQMGAAMGAQMAAGAMGGAAQMGASAMGGQAGMMAAGGAMGAQAAAGAMGAQMSAAGSAMGPRGGYGGQMGGRGDDYKTEFQSLDRNGDGRIDFAEYQRARGAAQAGAAAGGAGFNAGAASGGASAAGSVRGSMRQDMAPRPGQVPVQREQARGGY